MPFAAIKSFFDPSVQFGLQFEPTEAEAAADTPATEPASEAAKSGARSGPNSDAKSDGKPDAKSDEDEPTKPSEGAEVVRLDRFRKK